MNHRINRVLIANRGEIAIRIIKTLNKLGIESVAVYADDDSDAAFVKKADIVIPLHGTSLQDTYLNGDKIIEIAQKIKADAIHPGYGFLSENGKFAETCEKNNLVFIGPNSKTIKSLGNKTEARKIAQDLGVPVIERYSEKQIQQKSNNIPYPIILKASLGGGGRGMRICNSSEEIDEILQITKSEAHLSFGSDDIYIEKYIAYARHIEVQILGDCTGNIVHLFDRECSLQRRYQKIIEEAPSASISVKTKQKLYDSAVKLAKHIGYVSAGTFEFLVDKDESIYFIEVNTRIQVEHPVTELITGIDIIEQQLNIARGKKLEFSQSDITINGHSVECRICCEDPNNNFTPIPGRINLISTSKSKKIRVDSGISKGDKIGTNYDSLLFKIISHGENRQESIDNLLVGLDQTYVHGIITNLSFLKSLTESSDFKNNNMYTAYLEKNLPHYLKIKTTNIDNNEYIAGFLHSIFSHGYESEKNPWQQVGLWRTNLEIKIRIENQNILISKIATQNKKIEFSIDKERYISSLISAKDNYISFTLKDNIVEAIISNNEDDKYEISINGHNCLIKRYNLLNKTKSQNVISTIRNEKNGKITAPIHGKILKIYVNIDDKVKKGDKLVTLESMKIENQIIAEKDGIVKIVSIKVGQQVEVNSELLVVEEINE